MTIMLFDTPKIVIDQRPIVSSHGNDDFAAFADRHPHGDCYHGYHAAVDDHDDGDYHLELSDRPNRVRRDTSGSSACQFLSHAYVDGGDDDQTDDDCSGADHRDGCDGRSRGTANSPTRPSPTRPPSRPRSDPAAAPPAPSDSLHSPLGPNASLKYAALAAIGPPARPLEFPAPTVDRAVTLSTNVLDHRSGNVFRASSVLMKRPVHVKSCDGRTVMTLLEGVRFANGAAAARKKKTAATMAVASPSSEHDGYGRHHRSNSGNSHHSMHSWHSTVGTSGSFGMEGAGGATSMSSAAATTQQQQQQLLQQHLQNLQPCGMECELPDRAYCVRRKLCDTTYGSVRLCMVLKRRGRNILGGGVKGLAAGIGDVGIVGPGAKGGGNSGWDSLDKRKGGDQGMFGLIGEPAWETTEEMVAIKVINWSKLQSLRGRHLEDPIKELAAMQLLGNYHPNVISISDSLQDETHLFCIYPFVSGGDLYERVLEEMRLSPTGRMDESLARKWFRQILSALNQLQKKGICHRDLCMENILVDECNNIKIIDFGLCLRVPYADPNNRNLITDVSANTARRLMKAQGQGGTWEYMAPEVLKRDTFDGFAIDLWAVAIVLFELLIGKKPFSMPDAVDANFQYIAIKGDLAGLLRMKGVELEKEAVDLLQKMLYLDPKKRLTLAEVVDHPWVKRGYNGDKVTRMYSVEDLGLRWFINSNPIDDDGPSFGIDPARLRIFSCSSVDHILEKDVEDDDTTANETKSVRSLSPPTHPCQSGACHGSDLNSAGSGTVGIKYDERHLDAEMLDELDELYSNKKRYCITSCLNPRKWWPSQKSSKPGISSINERGSPRNDSEVVHVVQHVDGTIC